MLQTQNFIKGLSGKQDLNAEATVKSLKHCEYLFCGYIREQFGTFQNGILMIMASYYPITIISWNKNLINTDTSDINITINESFIHLSGHINFKSNCSNNYEQIGQIELKELYPNVETVELQALKGVWGDSRLTWNTYGIISIKPRKNIWLNVSIYCATEYQKNSDKEMIEKLKNKFKNKIEWEENQIDFKKSDLQIEKRDNMVYITGHLDFVNQQSNSGYIKIGQLCKDYIPLSHTLELVALKGVSGAARLEWYKDGGVFLKPKRNVWVNISFPTQN